MDANALLDTLASDLGDIAHGLGLAPPADLRGRLELIRYRADGNVEATDDLTLPGVVALDRKKFVLVADLEPKTLQQVAESLFEVVQA